MYILSGHGQNWKYVKIMDITKEVNLEYKEKVSGRDEIIQEKYINNIIVKGRTKTNSPVLTKQQMESENEQPQSKDETSSSEDRSESDYEEIARELTIKQYRREMEEEGVKAKGMSLSAYTREFKAFRKSEYPLRYSKNYLAWKQKKINNLTNTKQNSELED